MRYPVYEPYFSNKERDYVNACLSSTWISSKGGYINEFEEEFAKKLGVKYAISTNNGTTALHVALLAIGIKPNDEVIVPTLTYIASVNAITYCGAKPVFVDAKKHSWIMDEQQIENVITPKTKAIMAVHLYGEPCRMNFIKAIAKKHKLKIIEDCAESLFSKYGDHYTGTWGNVSAFSFFGNKTITTGEGGMVCTNDKKVADLARKLKGQGLSPAKEYYHDVVGYNYRMTNIQAAIGCAQLEKVGNIIGRKALVYLYYRKHLKGVIFQQLSITAPWMVSISVKEGKVAGLRKFLALKGIETRPVFIPIHKMPMYKQKRKFPIAEAISNTSINLPSYPGLDESDIQYICKHINHYVNRD